MSASLRSGEGMGAFAEVRATRKKSALVARQILQAFDEERYKAGDKLPPERLLADEMKVSRTCVREALKALEVLGLIESRVGDGTYVLPAAKDSSDWLRVGPVASANSDFLDVWEARAEIEAVIVKLAISSATPKTLGRLRSLLERMAVLAEDGDAEAYLNLDRQFHMAIARGADNPLLESMVNPLIQIINDSLLEDIPRARVARRLKVSVREHTLLLDAISRGDEKSAVKLTREHFSSVREFYGRKYW
jgi:DNA-binding FadR family transcriptional regulator